MRPFLNKETKSCNPVLDPDLPSFQDLKFLTKFIIFQVSTWLKFLNIQDRGIVQSVPSVKSLSYTQSASHISISRAVIVISNVDLTPDFKPVHKLSMSTFHFQTVTTWSTIGLAHSGCLPPHLHLHESHTCEVPYPLIDFCHLLFTATSVPSLLTVFWGASSLAPLYLPTL